MTQSNDPNLHITHLIDAYLAGGLEEGERRSFDAHVASCSACAVALDETRQVDARLMEVLSPARPPAGFEDRLLVRLRPGMKRSPIAWRWVGPMRHPLVRKIATGVAAAVVLGSVGYGMQLGAERDDRERQQADAGLRLATDSDGDGIADAGLLKLPIGPTGIRSFNSVKVVDSRDSLGRLVTDFDSDGTTNQGVTKQQPVGKEKEWSEARKKLEELRKGGKDSEVESESRTHRSDGLAYFDRGTASSGKQNHEWAEAKDGKKTGYDDILRYPADWPDISGVRDQTVAAERGASSTPGRPSGQSASSSGVQSPNFADAPDFNLQVAQKNLPAIASSSGPVDGPVSGVMPAKGGFGVGSGGGGGGSGGGQQGQGGAPTGGPGSAEGLARNGTGTLTLSGTSTYTGGTVVNGGVLKGNGIAAARGTIAVPDGGTLLLGGQTLAADGKFAKTSDVELLAAPKVELGLAFKPAEVTLDGFVVTGKAGDVMQQLEEESARRFKAEADVERSKVLEKGKSDANERETVENGKPVTKYLSDRAAIATADGDTRAPATPATSTPPADPKAVVPAPVTTPRPVQPEERPIQRMIIRNGEISFEVDSFDTALSLVSKITQEESGYVSTTDSEKLPNGRVRGSVTVRCPPERLDTLVLKLRGLGDLKSQKITAQDVTKKYTDIDSQLRAGRAMEERLLAIIKSGGVVKDLLEAEKQLGVWREKLEILEGEIRYLKSQVALSTLNIEIMERDARGPTAAFEVENINAGVEAEDVEKARTDALAAIDQVKGRVVDSDLKKQDGGQLIATIVADVAPDSAGAVTDRLKQIGKVARLDVSRKTTTQGGPGPIIPGLKVERKETRFQISIYNLARVAPRQTTTLTLAAQDVESAYKAILQQVSAAGGNVTSSQLLRPRADQAVGSIGFTVIAEKADALGVAVRSGSEVMQMQATTSSDLANTTEAKRGFVIEIKSLAHVPARESTTLQLAAKNVPQTYTKLLEAAKAAGGRVMASQLNEQDANNINGSLDFEVPREKWGTVDAVLQEGGLIVTRNVTRSPDAESTVDSKVRLGISLVDEIRLSPRETIVGRVATATVPEAFAKLVDSAKEAGARIVTSNLNQNDRMNPSGTLSFAVPRENAAKFETALKDAGYLASRTVSRLADGPTTVDTKVGFDLTVFDELQLRPRETVNAAIAAKNVPEAFPVLVFAAREAGARSVSSNLNLNDRVRPTGRISFMVPKENAAKFEAAMTKAGLIVTRVVSRTPDGQDSVETKIGFDVFLGDEKTLEPRETQTMDVYSRDVAERYRRVLDALRLVEAQVVSSKLSQENKNNIVGKLEFIVTRERRSDVEKALEDAADVFNHTVSRSPDAQNTVDYKLRFVVEIRDAEQQAPRQNYMLGIESGDLDKSIGDIEAAAIAVGGRKLDSSRSSAGRGREMAEVVVDVPLARAGEVVNAARSQGRVVSTESKRDDNVPEGTLSRARIVIKFGSPGSVQTEKGFGESIRDGISVGLNGLFTVVKYIITGLLVGGPVLLVGWAVLKLIGKARRRKAAEDAEPPTSPDAGATPTVG